MEKFNTSHKNALSVAGKVLYDSNNGTIASERHGDFVRLFVCRMVVF
jgi:hypothetical protein